MDKIELL